MRFRFGVPGFFLVLFLLSAGCDANPQLVTSSASQSSPAPSAPGQGVTTVAADPTQCPAGGLVIETFSDSNGNGQLDAGEPILARTPVCNGTPGRDGLGAGIRVTQATACPAGGIIITTFVDANDNGILDPAEAVTSQNTVCDGVNGNSFSVSRSDATAGQCPAGGAVYTVTELDGAGNATPGATSVVCNGTDGASVVFTSVPASAGECPNGGNVLLFASDAAGTGSYEATDPDQRSVLVCNGATGAQGPAGPVSGFAPIAPIEPCGAASSPWKEVLLCLADGSILSDFSATAQGDLTRLSFIPSGTYQDTDSSGCIFTVASDSNGGTDVSWGAGTNAYSSWTAGSYDCAPQTSPGQSAQSGTD
jgi:hypothetical protein